MHRYYISVVSVLLGKLVSWLQNRGGVAGVGLIVLLRVVIFLF